MVFDSQLPVYSTERDVEDVLSTRSFKTKSYAYQRDAKQVVDYADGRVILSPQCHFRITMTPNKYFFRVSNFFLLILKALVFNICKNLRGGSLLYGLPRSYFGAETGLQNP